MALATCTIVQVVQLVILYNFMCTYYAREYDDFCTYTNFAQTNQVGNKGNLICLFPYLKEEWSKLLSLDVQNF